MTYEFRPVENDLADWIWLWLYFDLGYATRDHIIWDSLTMGYRYWLRTGEFKCTLT